MPFPPLAGTRLNGAFCVKQPVVRRLRPLVRRSPSIATVRQRHRYISISTALTALRVRSAVVFRRTIQQTSPTRICRSGGWVNPIGSTPRRSIYVCARTGREATEPCNQPERRATFTPMAGRLPPPGYCSRSFVKAAVPGLEPRRVHSGVTQIQTARFASLSLRPESVPAMILPGKPETMHLRPSPQYNDVPTRH